MGKLREFAVFVLKRNEAGLTVNRFTHYMKGLSKNSVRKRVRERYPLPHFTIGQAFEVKD